MKRYGVLIQRCVGVGRQGEGGQLVVRQREVQRRSEGSGSGSISNVGVSSSR